MPISSSGSRMQACRELSLARTQPLWVAQVPGRSFFC